MLEEANYDQSKIDILIDGFMNGFDIGYQGPEKCRDFSDNIPFTMGDPFDMWEKLMKEVNLNRYAGPFTESQFPLDYFVQSPIGLVPKAGNKTRLIFHLSYDFKDSFKSVNFYTPKDICMVKYRDLDHAVNRCIELLKRTGTKNLFFGKTDLVSAFRLLPVKIRQRFLLTMKARHPVTQVLYYFIDKCLPFGSSISCLHFQLFSDALAALIQHHLNVKVTNYLDDFFFMPETEDETNRMVRTFIKICSQVGCQIAEEKTEYATTTIVFLGILLDGINH